MRQELHVPYCMCHTRIKCGMCIASCTVHLSVRCVYLACKLGGGARNTGTFFSGAVGMRVGVGVGAGRERVGCGTGEEEADRSLLWY